jgi:hypothetical protein
MADERLRTKRELKRLFTNLRGKPITDDMISILIDTLWRDRSNHRTSGFYNAGGYDAEISFNTTTRIFSIKPFDPLVEGFEPRYSFFSWANQAVPYRIFSEYQIEIPDEEGLFCVYFDTEPEPGRSQVLYYKKNPTPQELEIIHTSKVLISCFYWDATNNELLHFGDDKHGSQWNPQIKWYLHNSLGARCKTGLQITNYEINGDGSANNHAQFIVSAGAILHDDFELNIPESTVTMPVLFFFNQTPRFLSNNGYSVLTSNRLLYNSGLTSLAAADSGNFVIYHYFATNEINNPSRKIISVMGTAQYTTIQAAFTGTQAELDTIKNQMPMKGKCYIDSAIFQTSDNYTNAVKSRIIGFVSSLWPDTREYITEMLQGDIDGVNTVFTTSKPYRTGEITVLLNGLKEYQFSEINETTIQLATPPMATGFKDITECIYKLK